MDGRDMILILYYLSMDRVVESKDIMYFIVL